MKHSTRSLATEGRQKQPPRPVFEVRELDDLHFALRSLQAFLNS